MGLLEKAESGNEPEKKARRRPRRNPCQGRTNPQKKKEAPKRESRFSRRKDREKKAKDPKPVADLPISNWIRTTNKWSNGLQEIGRHPRRIWLDVPCRRDIRMGVRLRRNILHHRWHAALHRQRGIPPQDSTGHRQHRLQDEVRHLKRK